MIHSKCLMDQRALDDVFVLLCKDSASSEELKQ